MSIKPEPQTLIEAEKSFQVTLTCSASFAKGTMKLEVGDEPRAFSLVSGQPAALEQPVTVISTSSVSVQAGWATSEDRHKEVVVLVDDSASAPIKIR
jgi:hypothetical protein